MTTTQLTVAARAAVALGSSKAEAVANSLHRKNGSGGQIQDIRGKSFGRLAVKSFHGRNEHGHVLWDCDCECGASIVASGIDLRRNHTKSCGCLKNDLLVSRVRKHGLSKSKAYMVWSAMKGRCTNKRNKCYPDYGGRGIAVCDRWLSFDNFLSDMGEPEEKMMLERMDNESGYGPENCKWATRIVQSNNRRSNVMIKTDSDVMTMAQFAKLTGLHYGNIRSKINRGVRVILGMEISVSRMGEI